MRGGLPPLPEWRRIEFVRIVEVRTGKAKKVGHLGVASSYNPPQWITLGELLLNVSPR